MSTGTLAAIVAGICATLVALFGPAFLAWRRARKAGDGRALQAAVDRGRALESATATEAGRALRDAEARLAAGRSDALGSAASLGRDRLDGKLPQ